MKLFILPRRLAAALRSRLARCHPRRWLKKQLKQLWHSPRLLGDRYTLEDRTLVTVFTDQPEHFPHYQPLRPLSGLPPLRRVTVSVVATARNERQTAAALVAGLLAQSRLPDEIILVDTGSTDGTAELLQELAARSPVPFVVLQASNANIAQGRNQGIARASGQVIAVTDFGVTLPPDWLAALVAPFEADPAIEVSAGRYQAVTPDGQPAAWLLGRSLAQIEPQSFLPSGVCVAFTRQAWQKAGGYPEWLSLTGEDTYFALQLKRATTRWAFVPEAMVFWESPQGLWPRWRKAYRWSIGDGEAGMTGRAYRWAALKLAEVAAAVLGLLGLALLAALTGWRLLWAAAGLAALAGGLVWMLRLRRRQTTPLDELILLGTYAAELAGFLTGLSRRRVVDPKRFQACRGVALILAGVPIDDTGGGARWTQIALELIRRHYLVVFVNKFPKYETIELELNIRHPNLLTYEARRFCWDRFQQDYAAAWQGKPLWALVELPCADYLPLAEAVRQAGGRVVYDLLDDWATALGGNWYSAEIERQIIAASHVLTATAPSLAARLEKLSGREVALLPNAVNRHLFDPQRPYPRPPDWPAAAWTALYVGALWGAWFDWELLKRLAQTYPEAAVVVIGDYAGQCQSPPPNLHFLGLKAQRDLPAYLAHADVAIIPWKVNDITQATSPLKVYEYLAMHKPVVAPRLEPLHGLPGVQLAQDADEFVARVGQARGAALPLEAIEAFIQQNDWTARLDTLLRWINDTPLS